MTEAAIVLRIRRMLVSHGCWEVKTHGSGYGRAGVPDILACYKGRLIGLEVKQPGRKATLLQLHELKCIRQAGGIGEVVCGTGRVKEILDEVG